MESTWADIMKRCRVTSITPKLCSVRCNSAAQHSVQWAGRYAARFL
jgi:hypothetical protein